MSNDTQAGAKRSAAPGQPDRDEASARYSAFPFLITLSIVAILVNAAVSIDWSSQSALIIVEAFKRLLFLIAFLLGVCVVAVRSIDRQELDDRPAPWILASAIVGLGLFLLHNLIDFSMFEIGPMFFFALLAGAVLGLRLPGGTGGAAPRGRLGPLAVFVAAGVAWFVAAGALWAPILQAESLAQEADEAIRTAEPQVEAGPHSGPLDPAHVARAVHDLIDAWRLVPYNADYAFRAEQAELLERGKEESMTGRQLLDAAVAADPRKVRYLVARAMLERGPSPAQFDRAVRDYERILQLDPHNLELRSQFAGLLDQIGRHAEAAEQYRKVLQFNDALAKDEIRRLPDKFAEKIRKRLEVGPIVRPMP